MNLQQTIDELEKQSSQYAEAASALKALLPSGQSAATPQNAAPRRGRPAGQPRAAAASSETQSGGETESGGKTNGRKTKKKRTMSPETRAKLSAAATARHAQRKATSGDAS